MKCINTLGFYGIANYFTDQSSHYIYFLKFRFSCNVLTYNLMLGGNPVMDQHLIQGGVEILPVTSCHRNRDKFRPDGPLGSYADLTCTFSYPTLHRYNIFVAFTAFTNLQQHRQAPVHSFSINNKIGMKNISIQISNIRYVLLMLISLLCPVWT